jgi:hypothetical protein
MIAVVGIVFGLAAPAAAHQARSIAHAIDGSTIAKHSIPGNRLENNTVTGTQVKESTLGTVPNAAKLGGKSASSYLTTAHASATGLIKIPTGGASHVLFTRYPLTWSGTCVVSGSTDTFTLSVTAAEAVNFTQTGSLGTQVAKGASLEIDNGTGNGTPVQAVTNYSVTGADGVQYMGEFSGAFKETVAPCAVAITALG